MFKSALYRVLEGKHVTKNKPKKIRKKKNSMNSGSEAGLSGPPGDTIECNGLSRYIGCEMAAEQPPRRSRARAPKNKSDYLTGSSTGATEISEQPETRRKQPVTAVEPLEKRIGEQWRDDPYPQIRPIVPYKPNENNNLPAKIPETGTEILESTENDSLPDSILQPDSTQKSIWNEKKFPSRTRPISFTPKKLYYALVDYSNTTLDINKTLDKHHIETNTFWKLVRNYPEISATYLLARRHKAHQYGNAALRIWEQIPDNPMFYQTDRAGNPCLTTAAVRYMEVKAAQYHRFAQIHETGSYVPVSKQETVNKNLTFGVTLKGKLPQDFDLASATSAEIADLIRGRIPENKQ